MKEAKAGSATVGRETKVGSAASSALTAVRTWPGQVKSFLGDVRAETKRVTWPTAQQIRVTTVVVILTVFFFGTYFGILDWIYTRAVGWILQRGS